MSFQNKIRAEYKNSTWSFIDPANYKFRVPFDSAIMEVTHSRPYVVEGFVLSVHGVPIESVSTLPHAVVRAMGVNAVHTLARTQFRRNVMRLGQDGRTVKVAP